MGLSLSAHSVLSVYVFGILPFADLTWFRFRFRTLITEKEES